MFQLDHKEYDSIKISGIKCCFNGRFVSFFGKKRPCVTLVLQCVITINSKMKRGAHKNHWMALLEIKYRVEFLI